MTECPHVPEIVPWNAGWSGEEAFEIRPCRHALGRLAIWQPHAPGQGRPIFAKPHFVRQRRSIAEMRCTVCGEQTPLADRWWFGHGQIDGDARMFRTTEAPVHLACAHRALRLCPHLRGRESDLRPMPAGFRVEGAMLNRETVNADFGVNIMPGQTVIGALKICWPFINGRISA